MSDTVFKDRAERQANMVSLPTIAIRKPNLRLSIIHYQVGLLDLGVARQEVEALDASHMCVKHNASFWLGLCPLVAGVTEEKVQFQRPSVRRIDKIATLWHYLRPQCAHIEAQHESEHEPLITHALHSADIPFHAWFVLWVFSVSGKFHVVTAIAVEADVPTLGRAVRSKKINGVMAYIDLPN